MSNLSAAGLLAICDEGAAQHPLERALALLEYAWPDVDPSDFAAMSIGQRDAWLLALREQLFGARLTGVATCPACGERLELDFQAADIRIPAATLSEPPPAHEGRFLDFDGYRLSFRLPTSADLLAVLDVADAGLAQQSLLRHCVLSLERQSGAGSAPLESLPPDLAEALAEAMEQADPQGNVQLALDCHGCGHHWLMPFDILSYLWIEIEDWAQRTLHEVHSLASAYGWSERDILAMSPRRRQFYLELVLA